MSLILCSLAPDACQRWMLCSSKLPAFYGLKGILSLVNTENHVKYSFRLTMMFHHFFSLRFYWLGFFSFFFFVVVVCFELDVEQDCACF